MDTERSLLIRGGSLRALKADLTVERDRGGYSPTYDPTPELLELLKEAQAEQDAIHARLVEEGWPILQEHRPLEFSGNGMWEWSICRQCGCEMLGRGMPTQSILGRGWSRAPVVCSNGCEEDRNRKFAQSCRVRKEKTARTCESCGEEYQAKRKDARYCSPRCRKRASRAKSIP